MEVQGLRSENRMFREHPGPDTPGVFRFEEERMRRREEPFQEKSEGDSETAARNAAGYGSGHGGEPVGEALDGDETINGRGSRGLRRPSLAASAALKMIALYRRWISPLLPECCRFTPSCSLYADTAIRRFGLARGGLMAAMRIMRCNPFCAGGEDPVPGGPEDE